MKKIGLFILAVLFGGGVAGQGSFQVSPDTARQGESVLLSIIGDGTQFTQGSYSYSVELESYFNYIQSDTTIVIHDELIVSEFTFTSLDWPGIYDVNLIIIYDNMHISTSIPDAFELKSSAVNPPSIDAIIPEFARVGDTVTLTVSGSNTSFTTDSAAEFLLYRESSNVLQYQNLQVIDDETLQVDYIFHSTLDEGFFDAVYISDVTGSSYPLILEDAFDLLPPAGSPEIVEITPNTAHIGDALTLTIECANVDFIQASGLPLSALVSDNSTIFSDTLFIIDSTTVEAVYTFTEDYYAGDYDCVVAFQDLSVVMEKRKSFELLEKRALLNVEPDNAKKGETVTLKVTGRYTDFTQGPGSVWLESNGETIQPGSVQVKDDETIEAVFSFTSEHVEGVYDVTVLSDGVNEYTLSEAFALSNASSVENIAGKDIPLNIYPNPSANGRFILDGEVNGEFDVTVIDMNGRVITRTRITKNRTDLDLSKESAGTYLLILQNGKTRFTERLVISGN